MTHTLVNPQSNRALTASGHPSADVALRIVDENADGMVVRGARILATLVHWLMRSWYSHLPFSRQHPTLIRLPSHLQFPAPRPA